MSDALIEQRGHTLIVTMNRPESRNALSGEMLAIMVDRKIKESREKAVPYMIEELKKGYSILLYAEGTRNRTAEPLKEFKDGAFRIAIHAQAPLVVQTIVGAGEVNNPIGIHLLPGTIKVFWSKPIVTKGMTLEDVPALMQMVQSEMLRHLV